MRIAEWPQWVWILGACAQIFAAWLAVNVLRRQLRAERHTLKELREVHTDLRMAYRRLAIVAGFDADRQEREARVAQDRQPAPGENQKLIPQKDPNA